MTQQEIKEIIQQAVQEAQKESDKRMQSYSGEVQKESDKKMQDYVGALKEDSDHKFQAIMEYVQDIPAMKEKQEMMFEKMGEMAEKDTFLEQIAKNHEVRLNALEQKV